MSQNYFFAQKILEDGQGSYIDLPKKRIQLYFGYCLRRTLPVSIH